MIDHDVPCVFFEKNELRFCINLKIYVSSRECHTGTIVVMSESLTSMSRDRIAARDENNDTVRWALDNANHKKKDSSTSLIT